MQKQTITFQNKSLAVYTNNVMGKNAILFIHGNSMSSKIWAKQFESSLLNNYQLVAIDFPGHGESEHFETYDLMHLASCVSVVINTLELKDYCLVGNSLGGDIILQELNNLKQCKGIVLVNTPPVSKPPAMEKALLPNPVVGMFYAKDYDVVNVPALAEAMFKDVNNIPDFVISDFIATDGMVRQSIAIAVGAGNYNDEVNIVNATSVPVAIICGENEKIVNNSYYSNLHPQKLWQDKVHSIGNAAHCPQWENALQFNNALKEFIEGI